MSFERTQAANRRKTALLLVFLFILVVVVSLGMGVYAGVGGSVALVFAVVISVGSVWGSWWGSDRIVMRMTRAREVGPHEAPQLYHIVEEVCIASGLPLPRIAIVDDPAPNAFATGRDPEHSVVAFTTGLLQIMDRDELQGVAAHELAHIANRDTLVMSIAATTAGIVALVADLAWRISLFGGGDRKRSTHPVLLVGAVVSIILAPIAAALLRSAVSRSRETLADATAVAYTRNPAGLRRALEKLAHDSTVVRARSTAVSHLWIESPLGGKAGRLFTTHPPIAERIELLRRLEMGS